MAMTMLPKAAGQPRLCGSLSGSVILPAAPLAVPRRASVAAHAGRTTPNYKLEEPKRLWEAGSTVWYPGAEPPSYLDGSLPGDRGFDPLRLAENDKLRPWLVEGELYNGRVAMMSIVGMLWVEAVGRGPWGSAPFRVNYVLPYGVLVVLGHAIFATFELSRWRNFKKQGETGFLFLAPFDPLNLSNDYLRQAEVRNARLAMLANVGFWSQAAITQKGPLDNLSDHLSDPGHNNIFTSPVGKESLLLVIAVTVIPIYLEARKSLVPKELQQEPFRPFPFVAPDEY